MAAIIPVMGGTFAGVDWAHGTDCTQVLIVQVDGDWGSNCTLSIEPVEVVDEEAQAKLEERELNARRSQEGVRMLRSTHSSQPVTHNIAADAVRSPRPTCRRTATAVRNWRRR